MRVRGPNRPLYWLLLLLCSACASSKHSPHSLEIGNLSVLLYFPPGFTEASATAALTSRSSDFPPGPARRGYVVRRSYTREPTPTPAPTRTFEIAFGADLARELADQFRPILPNLKVVTSLEGSDPNNLVLIPHITNSSTSRTPQGNAASISVDLSLQTASGVQLSQVTTDVTSHTQPSGIVRLVKIVTLPITLPFALVGGLFFPQESSEILFAGGFKKALAIASSEAAASLATKLRSSDVRAALDAQRAIQQDPLDFDGHLRRLAKGVLSGQQIGSIAVFEFVPIGEAPLDSGRLILAGLSDALRTEGGFPLVEQELVDKILKQMSINAPTNALTATQLAEFARLASADFVLLGSMTPAGLRTRIDAGLIDVSSGRMVAKVMEEVILFAKR